MAIIRRFENLTMPGRYGMPDGWYQRTNLSMFLYKLHIRPQGTYRRR